MAMPLKAGLDYFPLSVGVFQEIEMLSMEARLGIKGQMGYLQLLCRIYGTNGYYLEYTDTAAEVLAVGMKTNKQFIDDTVRICLKLGLFDKTLFDKYGILTSEQIQRVYLDATRRRIKSGIKPDWDLVEGVKSKVESPRIVESRKQTASGDTCAPVKSQKQNVNILATKESKINTLPQTPSGGECESLCENNALPPNPLKGELLNSSKESFVTASNSVNNAANNSGKDAANKGGKDGRAAGAADQNTTPQMRFSPAAFVNWWNNESGMRPVGKLTESQIERIDSIIGEMGKDPFFAVLQYAARQDFYTGKNRSTRKGLAYILKPENWQQLVAEADDDKRQLLRRRREFFGG